MPTLYSKEGEVQKNQFAQDTRSCVTVLAGSLQCADTLHTADLLRKP